MVLDPRILGVIAREFVGTELEICNRAPNFPGSPLSYSLMGKGKKDTSQRITAKRKP